MILRGRNWGSCVCVCVRRSEKGRRAVNHTGEKEERGEEDDGVNECDEREKRERGNREREEKSDDREGERTGGGSNGKRGVKGRNERGSRGVVRVQGNEISICWREKRGEEIHMEEGK